MTNGREIGDTLGLVRRRRRYIQFLSEAPRRKRDVIDRLDDSRSTVDRAIEALQDAGLVARTDDGSWVATAQGEVLLRAVDEIRDLAGTVSDAGDLLPHLPCDEPVPPALFRDAVVDVADGPTPLAIAERVEDAVASADSLRGFSVADHDVGVKDEVWRSALGDESFELVHLFDERLVEEGLGVDGRALGVATGSPDIELRVHEDLPFGLFLTEHGSESRTTLVVYDERNVVRGQITSTSADAFDWATEVFRRYRDESAPLGERLE